VIIPAIIKCINLITDSCRTGSGSPSHGYSPEHGAEHPYPSSALVKKKRESKAIPLLPHCPFFAGYRVNITFCYPHYCHMYETPPQKILVLYHHLSHYFQSYSMAIEIMFDILCAHPIRVIP
jgi:hypothetical protein